MSRIREAAEKAKIELSGTPSTQINLPFITMRDGQPEHLDMPLTRSKFEKLTSSLVERTMSPTRQAMKDASIKKGDVDKVLLVGGSTRIPAVQQEIEKEVGGDDVIGGGGVGDVEGQQWRKGVHGEQADVVRAKSEQQPPQP